MADAGHAGRLRHRYITRPAKAGGENHVALTTAEFALRREHRQFAFHWKRMAILWHRREIHGWRNTGLIVVISGSREHFLKLAESTTTPIRWLMHRIAQRLTERLARRGRESNAATARAWTAARLTTWRIRAW